MKDCGIENIDKERREIENRVNSLVSEFSCCKSANLAIKAQEVKRNLSDFRMKLAYNRGTEALESYYNWTPKFTEMIQSLDRIINSTDQLA